MSFTNRINYSVNITTSGNLIVGGSSSIGNLSASSGNISDLIGSNITANSLVGTSMNLSGELFASNATIPQIVATNVSAGSLVGSTARLSSSVTLGNVRVSGDVSSFTQGNLTIAALDGGKIYNTNMGQLDTAPNTFYINSRGDVDLNASINLMVNNSSRMYINNPSLGRNNYVGINNISPLAPLHFANIEGSRKIVLWTDQNNDHQFFGLGLNAFTFRLQVNNPTSDFVFHSANSSTTSSELMRIKGNGNVGIGTNTPNSKLDVKGGTFGNVRVLPNIDGQEAAIGFLGRSNSNEEFSGTNTGNWLMGVNLSGYGQGFTIRRSNPSVVNTFAINNSGNIGIGTNNPTSKLHLLDGNIRNDNGFLVLNSAGSLSTITFGGSGAKTGLSFNQLSTQGNYSRFDLTNYDNATDSSRYVDIGYGPDRVEGRRLILRKGGNIGINNSSPNYTLDINGGTTGAFEVSNSNGLLVFNSLGNLGINTTSPTEKLHITGGNLFVSNGYVSISNSTTSVIDSSPWQNITLQLRNPSQTNNNKNMIYFEGVRTNLESFGTGAIGTKCLNYGTGGENSEMLFFTTINGTIAERMKINTAGNLGISTTSPNQRLHVVGNINYTIDLLRNNSGYTFGTQWASSGSFIFYTSGNVNIGSVGTSGRLYIDTSTGGTALVSSFLTNRFWSITNPTLEGDEQPIVLDTGNTWDFRVNQTSRLFINSGGGNIFRVGINNSNPGYSLDINGTFNVNNSDSLMLFNSAGNLGINSGWFVSVDGSSTDSGNSVTLDSSGNIYISGSYTNTAIIYNNGNIDSGLSLRQPSGGTAAYVVKYNSNGVAQWAVSVDGTGNDIGSSVVVDALGNVYLGGNYGSGAATIYNTDNADSGLTLRATSGVGAAFTVKYNSNGIAQWATSIDGTDSEECASVAVDTSGNVYVCGYYRNNTVVYNANNQDSGLTINLTGISAAFAVKYNSSGIAQWIIRIDGTGFARGYSISLDSSGNIYLAGAYGQNATTSFTIYNTNNTSSGLTLRQPGGGYGAFVVKYNSSGVAQWATSVDSSFNSDFAYQVKIGNDNSVYMVGVYQSGPATIYNAGNASSGLTLRSPGSGSVAFVVKYNSSGVAQWAVSIDGTTTTTGSESGNSVAIDNSGNVYMAGGYGTTISDTTIYNAGNVSSGLTLRATSGLAAAFLVKYNSNGIAQWATSIDSMSADTGSEIKLDNSGNIYMCGSYGPGIPTIYNVNNLDSGLRLRSSSGSAAFIVKYNSDGNVTTTNFDSKLHLSSNTSTNVIISGLTSSTSGAVGILFQNDNSLTIPRYKTQILAAGNGFWGQSNLHFVLNNVNDNNSATLADTRMMITASGNVGIGTTNPTQQLDVVENINFTGSLLQNGSNYSITSQWGTSGSTTFYTRGNVGIGTTAPNAQLQFGNINANRKIVLFEAADNDHQYIGFGNNNDTLRYQVDSTSASHQFFTGIATTTSRELMRILGNGNVGITTISPTYTLDIFGTFNVSSSGTPMIFNSAGNLGINSGWFVSVDGSSSDSGNSVTLDSSGNIYISGSYTNTAIIYNNGNINSGLSLRQPSGGTAAFVVKYNSSGVAQWAASVDSTGTDIGSSVVVDSLGNVYLGGYYGSASASTTIYNAGNVSSGLSLRVTSGNVAAFVVKYNSSGVAQWAASVDSTSADYGNAVAVDALGNVYLGGYYYYGTASPTIYNAGNVSSGLSLRVTSGNAAAFVVKYDSSGVAQWAASVDGTGTDFGNAVAVDALGNVYLGGFYYNATATIYNSGNASSGLTLRASVAEAAFVVKYNSNGEAQWAVSVDGGNNENVNSVAVDASGNVYLGGYYGFNAATIYNAGNASSGLTLRAANGMDAAFVVKYNSSGIAQWGVTLDGVTGIEKGNSVAVDNSENLYVCGYYGSGSGIIYNAANGNSGLSLRQSSGTTAAFLVKYNSNGTAQWATSIDGTSSDQASCVALDISGNIYMCGSYGPGIPTIYNVNNLDSGLRLRSSSGSAAFIVKYNSDGNVTTTNFDSKLHLSSNTSTNVIISGLTSSTSGAVGILFQNDNSLTIPRYKTQILAAGNGFWGQSNLHFVLNNVNDNNSATLADTRMVVTNNGNVGVGTSSPFNTLSIQGPSLNFNDGPHTWITTSDDTTYPIFQQLNLNRGNIALNFDMYWDGAWRTSSTSPGFQIYKFGTSFRLGQAIGSAGSVVDPTTLNNTSMVLGSTGNIGLGVLSPVYPLHVEKSVSTTSSAGYLYNSGITTGSWTAFSTSTRNISIYAKQAIMSSSHFIAASDARIKMNIEDINDTSALETIRQIEPKRYSYIDKTRGEEKVWGFLAQQVKSVLDYSVSLQTQFIPNVFERVSVISSSEDGSILSLNTKSTSELTNTNTSGSFEIVLQAYVDEMDTEKRLHVKEILDDKRILVEEELEQTEVFIYGQEVHDFHALNKDAIFAVSVAALQEVDRQLQEKKQKNLLLKERVIQLESRIKSKLN